MAGLRVPCRRTSWGLNLLEESTRAFQDTHLAIERYLCR